MVGPLTNDTKCVTDLHKQSMMIIFKSFLPTFGRWLFIFEPKNLLCPKTKSELPHLTYFILYKSMK